MGHQDINALRSLAERLGKATGPDRELDRLCGLAAGYTMGLGCWCLNGKLVIEFGDDGCRDPGLMLPASTASIDAALALVERMLPGWYAVVSTEGWCYLAQRGTEHTVNGPSAPTPALAILRALVASLIAQHKD